MPRKAYNARIPSEFGMHLWHLLTERGYTMNGFAREIGVSTNTVPTWCNGRNFPQMGLLWTIREALGCTWEELLG